MTAIDETRSTYTGKRLPILFVHGLHDRDDNLKRSEQWGRIPDWMRAHGSDVWFGNEDAFGSVDGNAKELVKSLRIVCDQTGEERIHIVAHSKGGLDAAHLACLPEAKGHIASLVLLGAMMHGMRLCTVLAHDPLVLPHVVAPIVNQHGRKMGDVHPDSLGLLRATTTKSCEAFLQENPPLPDIEYRSLAFALQEGDKRKFDIRSWFIGLFDGENDGIAPLRSTEYKNWIVMRAAKGSNFCHADSCDITERDVELTAPDGTVYPNMLYLLSAIIDELDEIAEARFGGEGKGGKVGEKRHKGLLSCDYNGTPQTV